ncbi:hypothetical protein [Rhodococcus sp. B10]|uniref:hypothetical protein n=1 Tax=Rhodococcus sp. B10 TaxID=2695876 RepID=UPI001431661F|nr:hypothetical protein [Rhodococcus sp. B10]NIL76779.1 hypothetical protein [Rhodococcus sp. B10]
MAWPFDSQDRDAIRVLALSSRECLTLAVAAYTRAELAYAEGNTVLQAHELDRANYWQTAATGFE